MRDLYTRGLEPALVASLALLSSDPEIRSFSREIARWRLVLDSQFARLASLEAIEAQIRGSIQVSSEKGFSPEDRRLLSDYEAVIVQVQVQVETAAMVLDKLRALIIAHVATTDGAKIVGDITVGDLQMMLGTVIQEVQAQCGEEKARLIAEKVRETIGRLDMGLPAASDG